MPVKSRKNTGYKKLSQKDELIDEDDDFKEESSGYKLKWCMGMAVWTVLYIISIGLIITLFLLLGRKTGFKLKTHHESYDTSDPKFDSTYQASCGEKELGLIERIFEGETTITIPCPLTDNNCSYYLCLDSGDDVGKCQLNLTEGSECYSNAICGSGFRCDLGSCGCVPIDSVGSCVTSDDCPQTPDRDCSSYQCESNQCVERVNPPGDCWENEQCADGFECDQFSCMCEEKTVQCINDNQCPLIRDNQCQVYNCNATTTTCERVRAPGAECSRDGDCGIGFQCVENCTCEMIPPNFNTCDDNSDCPVIQDTTCQAFFCVGNECVRNRTIGSECSRDGDCNIGFQCNQDCECQLIPPPVNTCSDNGDCPQIDDTMCQAFFCVANECVRNNTIGSQCSSEADCLNGETCNSSCMCEQIELIDQCNENSDCPDLSDRPGNCVEMLCISGRCTENRTMGSECWYDKQCGSGFSCDTDICGCVPFTPETNSSFLYCLDERLIGLDHPRTGSNPSFTCGVSVYISGDWAVDVCINRQSSSPNRLVSINLYNKDGFTWRRTSSVNTGIPSNTGALVDNIFELARTVNVKIDENLISVSGKVNGFPNSLQTDIYEFNMLTGIITFLGTAQPLINFANQLGFSDFLNRTVLAGTSSFDQVVLVTESSPNNWNNQEVVFSPFIGSSSFGRTVDYIDEENFLASGLINGTDSYVVIMNRINATDWQALESILFPGDTNYGVSLDWFGDTIVIGKQSFNPYTSVVEGEVVITDFMFNIIQTIPFLSPDDGFGYSVSIYENTLIVGAPTAFENGIAYLYTRPDSNVNSLWTLQNSYTSTSNGFLGYDLFLESEIDLDILIGDPRYVQIPNDLNSLGQTFGLNCTQEGLILQ